MANVFEMVTEQMINALNEGKTPWQKPWAGGEAINYVTRKAYRGINRILLSRGGEYLTFNQAKKLGGHVKKGAKGEMVVFFSPKTKTQVSEDENGNEVIEEVTDFSRFILKYYYVFHISDVEGVESKLQVADNLNPIDEAEKVVTDYVTRSGISFEARESSEAYYVPAIDKVVVPALTQYKRATEYYSTVFHEFGHSTMKADRCNRMESQMPAAFGGESYSREELVAEICSAMICSKLGFTDTIENSKAYVRGWCEFLKSDPKAVVYAAARAEKAANFILNEQ